MQLKLGDNVSQKKLELEQKRTEEENDRKEREKRQRYFKENFKEGATTIWRWREEYYFWGDIAHCGKENIFHNARKIKSMLKENGMMAGHMSYNDPPTFDSKASWEEDEKDRKTLYQDDLYKFIGDKIVLEELIGNEPIGHIYKNCVPDDNKEQNRDDEPKQSSQVKAGSVTRTQIRA